MLGILSQIMQSVFDFIMNYQFPIGNGSYFTLYEVFLCTLLLGVFLYFITKVVLFFRNYVGYR